MDVTVAICTWNRAKLLDMTLSAMRMLNIPAGTSWELLIVNNRCTDETDQIIQKHADHLPIRRLFEDKPGLSNARNCAVAAARGTLLIWTDDDVVVNRDWLAAYVDASNAFPDAVYFGGAVDPLFSQPPPRWIVQNPALVEWAFAIRQLGPDVRLLRAEEYPVGASMAFRRCVFERMSFDPMLGHIGSRPVGGEESVYVEQLKQERASGVWVGTARLQHYIAPHRLSRKYIRKWWVGSGVQEMRRSGVPDGVKLFGMPRWMLRQFIQHQLKSWCLVPWVTARWAQEFRRAAETWGALLESRECVRKANGPAVESAEPAI